MSKPSFKRILLKVSGEVLAGDQSFGIETAFLEATAKQIAEAARAGVRMTAVGRMVEGQGVRALYEGREAHAPRLGYRHG